MLCTPTIYQVAVTRTLINSGAGLNVLSIETFNLLHMPLERLDPASPFRVSGAAPPALWGRSASR